MIQLAIYAAIAAFVVAAGVTVVETYNHNITKAAAAETRATNAEANARQARKSQADLQELVDYGDNLTKGQQEALAARDRKIRDMEARNAAAGRADPRAFACESTPVPPSTRQLRRDTFGTPVPGDGVLHPASPVAGDAGPAPARRDVRPGETGSGPGPVGAPLVQPGQGERAPAAGEAKPSTQSLRERIRALMRK